MFEYGKNNGIFSEKAKFVHVNCSEYANNPELITANLFGYKRGAFTGADNDNPGPANRLPDRTGSATM